MTISSVDFGSESLHLFWRLLASYHVNICQQEKHKVHVRMMETSHQTGTKFRSDPPNSSWHISANGDAVWTTKPAGGVRRNVSGSPQSQSFLLWDHIRIWTEVLARLADCAACAFSSECESVSSEEHIFHIQYRKDRKRHSRSSRNEC